MSFINGGAMRPGGIRPDSLRSRTGTTLRRPKGHPASVAYAKGCATDALLRIAACIGHANEAPALAFMCWLAAYWSRPKASLKGSLATLS